MRKRKDPTGFECRGSERAKGATLFQSRAACGGAGGAPAATPPPSRAGPFPFTIIELAASSLSWSV